MINSKALYEESKREVVSRWKTFLGVGVMFYLMVLPMYVASPNPDTVIKILLGAGVFCVLYLMFELQRNYSLARDIDRELGHAIYDLEALQLKYDALEVECAILRKK